jgi:hypothetical protein
MANFISNAASAELTAATLDLSTGNYYAHLVTTIPLLTQATAADLVLPTTSGYASTPLTGLSYNSTRWTFDSFSFPKYNFVAAPKGIAICKRAGTTPANTDRFICYSDFNNSIGQNISLQVGVYVVNLQFGSRGAINFSYKYKYSSGSYINTESVPKGLIYLIGSKNNTTAFVNPASSGGLINLKFNNTSVSTVTNRVALEGSQSSLLSQSIAFDFGGLQINPVNIGLYNYVATFNTSVNVNIYGSNSLPSFSASGLNSTYYTNIYSGISSNWINKWDFFAANTSEYWRYLLFTISASNLLISEIEFYDSSIISPTLNFN